MLRDTISPQPDLRAIPADAGRTHFSCVFASGSTVLRVNMPCFLHVLSENCGGVSLPPRTVDAGIDLIIAPHGHFGLGFGSKIFPMIIIRSKKRRSRPPHIASGSS